MDEHDAERRVDVERLRLLLAVGVAGGRIAHLAEADVCRAAPRMLRVRKTSRTMPRALCMKHLVPCIVTMPAASWPRCCSSSKRVVDQLVDRRLEITPTMPHMGWALDQDAARDQAAQPGGTRASGSNGLQRSAAASRQPRAPSETLPGRRAGRRRAARRRRQRQQDQTPRSSAEPGAHARGRARQRRRVRPARAPAAASRPQTISATMNAACERQRRVQGANRARPTGTCGASHGRRRHAAGELGDEPADQRQQLEDQSAHRADDHRQREHAEHAPSRPSRCRASMVVHNVSTHGAAAPRP